MIILDANYILRFLLEDDEKMYQIAKDTIISNQCFIDNEVLAEVVFVLLKVYKTPKSKIKDVLEKFISFENILLDDKSIILTALKIFVEKNLDFVDAILCAKSKKYSIKTFDKKLKKCIDNYKHNKAFDDE